MKTWLANLSQGVLRALALGILLFLSLAAALSWAVATERGLQWLASQLNANLPGVQIDAAAGTLLRGFVLKGVGYKAEGLDAHLDSLEMRLEPEDLWRRRLHFRSIALEGARYVSTQESTEPPAWPEWTLPLELAIDDFRLRKASVQTSPGAQLLRIDSLDAALHVTELGLKLERFALKMPEAAAEMSGRVGFTGARRVDLKTRWTATLPGKPEFKGEGGLLGDRQHLILRQSLKAPLPAELTVVLEDPLNKVAWTAQVDVPRFLPSRIDKAWQPWPATLSLQGRGTLKEAGVAGNFLAEIPEVGEARGRLQARWKEPGDVVIETLNLALPKTGSEFNLAGKVGKLDKTPEFDLAADWKNLAWPPDPKTAEWKSPEGKLAVKGSLKDVRFDLAGKLRGLPVEAGGNIGIEPNRTVFRGIRVRGAGTAAEVDGTLGQTLDFIWAVKASDLGLWLPGAKGSVDSRGTLKGTQAAPVVDADLTARDLRYRDGGARDLKLMVKADLGVLQGGRATAPADAELEAHDLHHQDKSVRELRLKLKAGVHPDSPFGFDLTAADINAAGLRLSAELAGQGTRADHKLEGRIRGAVPLDDKAPVPATLDFAFEGGLKGEQWQGRLTRFDAEAAPIGRWDLERPAALQVSRAGGELGWTCWESEGTEFCLQPKFSSADSGWQVATDLSRLPVARFKPALPEAAGLAGVLHAKAQFSGKGGQVTEGWLDLDADHALLEYRADPKHLLQWRPEPLSLRVRLSQRGSRATLVAEHAGVASIRADVALSGPPDPARIRQMPLDAEFQVDVPNLAVFGLFAPDLENLKGSFHADARAGGTVAAPVLELHAGIPDMEFGVPKAGIRLTGIKLEAVTHAENQLTLRGRAVSGKGEVRLDGTATLSEAAGWPVNLALKGKRFLAADIPEAKVFVSQDMALAYGNGKLELTGKLAVPEATIGMPERAGAIRPSDDVIIVGEEAPPDRNPVLIETRVDVALGDKVRVKAKGFTGRLGGQVLVEQAPKGPVLGTGQITIHDGTYRLYGVELAINDGRILFARSPIDNPGLDINVTRKSDDVLAGVRILGTVERPTMNLYSDRTMSQTDILAYLVTGSPMSMASKEQGGMLQGAAASLGGSAGGFLAKEIGARLGLSDFVDISVQSSLDSQSISRGFRSGAAGGALASGQNRSALFLGKYLTPRIYLQYGMGLFQNAYVFRLRYALTENWKIQTETGEYSGGDILYQWEQ